MALTKEQQAIEDAYQRAKQRADAQKAIQLQQAAENLAMQTRQNTLSREQAQASATQQGQQAYIAGQQAQRVLPSQMAQGGLAQSGYRSLAQQKLAQETQKVGQGVSANLAETNRGLGLNLEAQQQNYGQNVQSLQNEYNQDIADLRLNRQQRLVNLEAEATNNVATRVPTGYNQNLGGVSKPPKTIDFNEMVNLAEQGQFTYNQYKEMLKNSGKSATEISAYLRRYLSAENKRNLQRNARTGEQVL